VDRQDAPSHAEAAGRLATQSEKRPVHTHDRVTGGRIAERTQQTPRKNASLEQGLELIGRQVDAYELHYFAQRHVGKTELRLGCRFGQLTQQRARARVFHGQKLLYACFAIGGWQS
jgi:hypothetical protein